MIPHMSDWIGEVRPLTPAEVEERQREHAD